MKEKLLEHGVVRALSEIAMDAPGSNPVLVGGAVVDIIDGREPKDYDIIVYGNQKSYISALEKCGYRLLMDSSTAITYFFGDIVVQLLKTNLNRFDFTVSQSTFNLESLEAEIQEHEIKNKLLIPVNLDDKKCILSSLSRIPHWRKKGYDIKEQTYYTLLNKLIDSKTQETREVGVRIHS